MDTLSEDFVRTDVDTQMTVLTHEDISEQEHETSDEVEDLRNSLREAVHDETVRPKMQCLMMDASFSMVTVQGEDSGIEWETSPSRCTTPWASEAGNSTLDFSSPVTVRPTTPGSLPAGRIIIVMDEQQISRRKKTKERVSDQKSKADRQRELAEEDADAVSGRPELVGVSLPNVKPEGEGDEEEVADPVVDKEQRLFRLVSEGSEILNIVVPPKLATVDEEESKEMVDNLSYLEEIPVTKSSEETNDKLFDLNNELVISTQALPGSGAGGGERAKTSHPIGPNVMDPPGAPVARPPGRGAVGNVDYFEKFTLIDAQAPGSPAVTTEGQEELYAEEAGEIQDTKEPVQSKESNTAMTGTVDTRTAEEEISSELLDEVFYGGMDDTLMKSALDREGCEVAEGVPSKFPLKESGSALFGSQEDILTPIFLPDGPPKIIDPILLEEPKAMAFLYTDLYEEAMGSRKKEEDTESMTSEKSFHSRHSDREARGYLEKYVLKDETPVLEMEPTDKDKLGEELEGGIRLLSEDSYNFADLHSNPEKREMPNAEEEITDFFRSSANSSPCDVEPFPQSLEENDIQSNTKKKASKTTEKVVQPAKITAKENVEIPIDPLEFFPEEPDWGSSGLDGQDDGAPTDQELGRHALAMHKPVAPPRKKAASSPKSSLDLTPLTPVDVIEEKEEAGGKEQREEEKETASPAETADEGDGDDVALSQDALITGAKNETQEAESEGKDNNNETIDTEPALVEGNDTETVAEERGETGTAKTQTAPEEVDIKSSESAKAEVKPEKQGDSSTESTREGESKSPAALVTEPAKASGQCIIL